MASGSEPAKPRRTSIQAMQEALGVGGATRHGQDMESRTGKQKKSMSDWNNFSTVSWRADQQKDYDEHTSVILQGEGWRHTMWALFQEALTWLIPALGGILTATSGAFIEKNVEWFGAMRFGYCAKSKSGSIFWQYIWFTPENCEDFVYYSPNAEGKQLIDQGFIGSHFDGTGYIAFIIVSTVIAAISATLTWAFAPMSRGSGIPEIKTILGGFSFPEVLAGNTLVIKIIGLSMSVGAGLSCGKEGPLVHISCCWSNFLAKFFKRYKDNEAKQRELTSCAAAAGVAVAFGAPLGGVLFSLEEASSIFPTRTMLRAFFAASVAAATLQAWNPTGAAGNKLTMFQASYGAPPLFAEYPVIVLIGIVGGVIGATFVHFNVLISKHRGPGTWFRSKCHIILEVALISFFTAITSYHLFWTRILSNAAIRGLFQPCTYPTVSTQDPHEYLLDLCQWSYRGHTGVRDTPQAFFAALTPPQHLTAEDLASVVWHPRIDSSIAGYILLTGLLRFVQMTFTFGTGAAAGLFIPSLLTGACLGRIAGNLVYYMNQQGIHPAIGYGGGSIHPGMYAMLGAAGVLGGVCRVTISLVVIMFELTGGLQLIVPFMVVCMLAKWVGDRFTIGIYDALIVLRKYPFLHEPDEVTYSHNADHVCDEMIDTLHVCPGSVGGLISFLEKAKHGGYPVTRSAEDKTLLGYVHTPRLLAFLKKRLEEDAFIDHSTKVAFVKALPKDAEKQQYLDISRQLDETVVTCVRSTPAAMLQSMFRNLGVKLIMVRDEGLLHGMITKKNFIQHMEELHAQHDAHDEPSSSSNQFKEPLLAGK